MDFHVGQPVAMSISGTGMAIIESHTVKDIQHGVVQLCDSAKVFDARTGEWMNDGTTIGLQIRIDPQ